MSPIKNNILALVLAIVVVTPLSGHATNGDQMIATGTRSMGMGGVSVATPFGAETGLANPALITYVQGSEVSGSLTLFFPDIATKAGRNGAWHDSASDFFPMPAVQYATHLDGNVYAGVGLWAVGGMGVDFSGAPAGSGLLGWKDDLVLLYVAAPFAMRKAGFSLGVAPDIEYDNGRSGILRLAGHPFDKEWDANLGAVVGMAYDFDSGLIIGGKYRTPISMKYSNSEGGQDFKLQQPGEWGLGLSYRHGPHFFAVDYKRIQWGGATGYEKFGWRDQDVYALGYQYETGAWAFRMGYNHGKSPIDTSRTSGIQDYMNLLGFPATSEDHYTLGGSYRINERFTLDLAAIYSPEEKTQGTIYEGPLLGSVDIWNKHSEFSLTAQINYTFLGSGRIHPAVLPGPGARGSG